MHPIPAGGDIREGIARDGSEFRINVEVFPIPIDQPHPIQGVLQDGGKGLPLMLQ